MRNWIVSEKKMMESMLPIRGTKFYYFYNKGEKFQNDKIVIDSEQVFMLVDGVIFNKSEICTNLAIESWEKAVLSLYASEGIKFVEKLRGSYNGIVIEKGLEELYAFVSPIGERPVFYCMYDEIIISSDFNLLIELLKKEKIAYFIDKTAIKYMLYFGYMVDNRTCIKQVKRIFPGNYLSNQGEQLKEYEYFRFDNQKPLDKSDDEWIELIDATFVKALKYEMDKDKEYGYEHLLDISGGMDARTVNFVAKKHGYRNITNICYSQINAYEKLITEKLVRQLGNDYIFKSLDNASFIYDVDDLVRENFGLSFFAGITGGKDFLKILDKGCFGMEHTGILGDVYEGSFSEKSIYEKPHIETKYRFSKLLDIELDTEFLGKYDDNELFLFYTRGILAGTSTHLIRRNYFETYSPFEDVDFLKLMFAIPLKKRIDEKIYMKWVKKKYPEILEICYNKTMCKPERGILLKKIRVLWNVILIKYLLPLQRKLNYNSEWNYKGTMNPFEYWYEKNDELKKFMDSYYIENIEKVDDPEIHNYLECMQDRGNVLDKLIMMTVLSIYKQYAL